VLVEPSDVVRAAFVWNLAVELARLGVSSAAVAPADEQRESLWPEPGLEASGAEFVTARASGRADLLACAREQARKRAGGAEAESLVLAQLPTAWLEPDADDAELPAWALCFTTPDLRELQKTFDAIGRLYRVAPHARVGVTVHGARSVGEARGAFFRLARATEEHLGRGLLSYGLLLDDLDVYRAIVSRRAIGSAHPQSRAARALRDVAELLVADAEEGPEETETR